MPDARAALAAVVAIRALHEPYRRNSKGQPRCKECGFPWPCATVQALPDLYQKENPP